MPSPRRLAVAFALAAVLAGVAAEAPPGPAATPAVAVKVKPPEGEAFEADVGFAELRFESDFGSHVFRVERLKELTVEKIDQGIVSAGLQLDDGTRFSGKLKDAVLPIRVNGEARDLAPVEGMALRFHKPGDFGLLAAILGLITLVVMEIVLGIDNIVVLAIISGKLPAEKQPKARKIGLAVALLTRIGLLFTLTWLLGLTKPLFTLPQFLWFNNAAARGISGRDLVLLVGGLFLIRKSAKELHENVDGDNPDEPRPVKAAPSFVSVIVQIAVIDIVFSLDSVITAVGMVEQLWVMVTAMIIAVGVMMAFAEPISRFINRHPSVTVLALSFLVLIGVLLVAEGCGLHIDKGYVYFAMAFAMGIEVINMRMRKSRPSGKTLATPAEPGL